jgi:hypothetical protein
VAVDSASEDVGAVSDLHNEIIKMSTFI